MNDFLKNPDNGKIFDAVKNLLFAGGYDPDPKVIIYGGQPGSGKAAMKPIISLNNPGIAVLDGDEFRKLHPDYQSIKKSDPENMPALTQQFVYDLLGALTDYAHEQGKSYALETTFHDGPKTQETFREEKLRGFDTELHILAVHPKISFLSTFRRTERGKLGTIGRTVSRESHFDRAQKNMAALRYCCDNKVADSLYLYKREIKDGKPEVVFWKADPQDPVGDFLSERARDLTPKEREAYHRMAVEVMEMMEVRMALQSELNIFKEEFREFLNYTSI